MVARQLDWPTCIRRRGLGKRRRASPSAQPSVASDLSTTPEMQPRAVQPRRSFCVSQRSMSQSPPMSSLQVRTKFVAHRYSFVLTCCSHLQVRPTWPRSSRKRPTCPRPPLMPASACASACAREARGGATTPPGPPRHGARPADTIGLAVPRRVPPSDIGANSRPTSIALAI